MNLLVCIKQVPDSNEVMMNADYTLERRYAARVMNPADESALEWALKTRDQCGGTVTAVSMGPAAAESTLREALSRGADKACLISDRRFAGADTLVTARCLAAAVRAMGSFDVITCGRRATDGETGQVGPMLAAMLDVPCVPNVTAAEAGSEITVRQLTEGGFKTWVCPIPAVLTFCEWSCALRLPTLTGLRAARSAKVRLLTPDDIGLREDQCGLKASPTRVVSVRVGPSGARPCKKLPAEDVMAALDRLRGGEAPC